jgi:copper chaperone CopZ
MKQLSIIAALLIGIFSSTISFAQKAPINYKKASIKVWGNCESCKTRIENAAKNAGAATAYWDADSQILSVSFEGAKSSSEKIQKAIAAKGHDTQDFATTEAAYKKLPGCCKYERKGAATTAAMPVMDMKKDSVAAIATPVKMEETKTVAALPQLLSLYYDIKNALISSNANTAAAKATAFLTAIKAVDMKSLSEADHNAFMPLQDKLIFDATHISESKDVDHQRDHFSTFSTNFYSLAKAVKLSEKPVYQAYCPMKKMYWLSSEAAIKNPYYGKMMLTCGKVTDTIQ